MSASAPFEGLSCGASRWTLRYRARGSEPAGVAAVLSQDPHSHPRQPKKSSTPRFHAFHEIRRALYDAYSVFLGLFQDAAEKWKLDDRHAYFPIGSLPPGLPFVSAG